ncbi:MAG TPA: hypothetical protein VNC50_05780 [Planctomycetia bacterium]|jgi:hypothetical protein|nr:hypothetical protein [Planctomycetia bacterium]
MKRWWLAALAVAVGTLAGAGTAQAQSLSGSERLFLYYNYYQNQKAFQQARREQATNVKRFDELASSQAAMARNLAVASDMDPLGRYIPTGRSAPVLERSKVEMPPHYGGRGATRMYFMRNPYFNPRR